MKLLLAGLLLLSVLPRVRAADAASSADAAAAASLEIAWEAEKDAVAYELEVKSAGQTKFLKIFETKETKFQENLPAGRYRLRIRSVNKDGDKSRWSSPVTVNASPPQIAAVSPKPGEKIVAKTKNPKVEFIWQKIASAQAYLVKVWSKDLKKPEEHVIKGHKLSLTLEIGKTYFWTVSRKAKNGVVYESEQTPFQFSLIGDRLQTPKLTSLDQTGEAVQLQWTHVPHAQSYRLQFFRRDLLGDDWQPVHEEAKAPPPPWALPKKLEPGEYRLEMTAEAPNYLSSKKLIHRFLVKPKLSELAEIR